MVPSCALILSPGKLPTALDHVILGDGWPVAVQAMVTLCFSSAISRLDDNESRGPTGRKQKISPGYYRKSELKRSFKKIIGPVACSRLSDNGEDAKVKGTRKVGGAGSPQFPPV